MDFWHSRGSNSAYFHLRVMVPKTSSVEWSDQTPQWFYIWMCWWNYYFLKCRRYLWPLIPALQLCKMLGKVEGGLYHFYFRFELNRPSDFLRFLRWSRHQILWAEWLTNHHVFWLWQIQGGSKEWWFKRCILRFELPFILSIFFPIPNWKIIYFLLWKAAMRFVVNIWLKNYY